MNGKLDLLSRIVISKYELTNARKALERATAVGAFNIDPQKFNEVVDLLESFIEQADQHQREVRRSLCRS